MKNDAISSRYAKVLFDLDCAKGLSEKQVSTKQVAAQRVADFEWMVKVLKDNPRLVRFLKAPQVIFSDKKKVLHDLFDEKFDRLFINFIISLVKKQRLGNFGFIANEYKQMVNENLGIWEADIVSAVPLDGESEAMLKQKLEKDFHKKMIFNKNVDPQIIGGVILVMANEMLDWSVTGRLRKIKENLKL